MVTFVERTRYSDFLVRHLEILLRDHGAQMKLIDLCARPTKHIHFANRLLIRGVNITRVVEAYICTFL